jgi:hypothetical protein
MRRSASFLSITGDRLLGVGVGILAISSRSALQVLRKLAMSAGINKRVPVLSLKHRLYTDILSSASNLVSITNILASEV